MTFGQITSIIIDIKPKEVINMDKYKKFASDRKDDIVSLLSELVAIPSVMGEANPGYPFGEAPANALVAMLDGESSRFCGKQC